MKISHSQSTKKIGQNS